MNKTQLKKKTGRPKILEESKTYTFQIELKLLEKLKQISEEREVPVGTLIRQAVIDAYDY